MTLYQDQERIERLGREVDLDASTGKPPIRDIEDQLRETINVRLLHHRSHS